MNDDVKWTAKGPALIAGIILFVAGLFSLSGKWRYATIVGAVLILSGGGFICYSMTIKEWCVERNVSQSAFSSAFGGAFHQCLRQKGWLEF